MNYDEALDFIHSVSWKGSKPGLERTAELLGKINNPQNKLKFIHVAGTNGKGSFCSMLESILRSAGYRVGLYTSPFVERFNERMKVNGADIDDETLASITGYVKPFAESMRDSPTEFELITAIALEYFKRENCDYVVFECGMGGRLDSTNVIETPVLSVITGISLDHTAYLGDTVGKIAAEKAGIIKKGIPCLWCGNDSEAYRVISKRASELGSELYTVGRDELTVKKEDLDGTCFDYGRYKDLKIPLLGTYQVTNALNVISAVEILRGRGIEISDFALYGGLSEAKWKARFEIICRDPIVIFDGGHNPEGVDSAVESVRKYFGGDKLNVVTGVLADKDYGYIAKKISEIAERVYCLTPGNPRALSATDYAAVFNGLGVSAQGYDGIGAAVYAAMSDAAERKKNVICIGSLYIYADVKKAVKMYADAECRKKIN